MKNASENILIVDDDDQLRKSFVKLLTDEGYEVQGAASGEEGLEIIKKSCPDLAIIDVRLPGKSGIETFRLIHQIEPKLPVVVMTAFGTTETAIEATKLGAFDYILKPFEIPEMLQTVKKALETGRFMRSPVSMNPPPENIHEEAIIGKSKAMHEIYKEIGRVAPTDATVLVRGESGTGKELAARAIYQHSNRADRPFLAINCVAIPETLLESELFGYEKGAFTGATHRRVGKIEQARGGTVFLDEIGDMPLSLQAKILRLIQEKSIERLGGRETVPTDVRIVAATNRDLEKAIGDGRFREDLYYRLKVVSIWLPPLRKRPDDIPLLAKYFLASLSAKEGIGNPGITPQAVGLLSAYPWPGNVREFSNTIQKVLIFNRGAPITPEEIQQALAEKGPETAIAPSDSDDILREHIRQDLLNASGENFFETRMESYASLIIQEALKVANGNRSKAAKLLGLSRPTLHARIDKYGIRTATSIDNSD